MDILKELHGSGGRGRNRKETLRLMHRQCKVKARLLASRYNPLRKGVVILFTKISDSMSPALFVSDF